MDWFLYDGDLGQERVKQLSTLKLVYLDLGYKAYLSLTRPIFYQKEISFTSSDDVFLSSATENKDATVPASHFYVSMCQKTC